LMKIYQI